MLFEAFAAASSERFANDGLLIAGWNIQDAAHTSYKLSFQATCRRIWNKDLSSKRVERWQGQHVPWDTEEWQLEAKLQNCSCTGDGTGLAERAECVRSPFLWESILTCWHRGIGMMPLKRVLQNNTKTIEEATRRRQSSGQSNMPSDATRVGCLKMIKHFHVRSCRRWNRLPLASVRD